MTGTYRMGCREAVADADGVVLAVFPPGKAGAGSRAAEPGGSCWHNSVGMFMGDGAEKEV